MKTEKNRPVGEDNIVLIGFMGVGKGRTARALAGATGMFAVDCDDLIESFAKKKIRKIFREDGEERFRGLERQVADWLAAHVTRTIVSTGGGFIQVPNLGAIGRIVYLHEGFDAIVMAIKDHPKGASKLKKRPLLRDMEAARRLYDQRLSLYRRCADLEISMAQRPIERVVEEIVDRLGLPPR